MSIRPHLSFALLALLALSGFGCKKTPTTTVILGRTNTLAPIAADGTADAPALHVPQPTFNAVEAVDYLRTVMRNFSQVRSFRASLKIPIGTGFATGQLESEGTKMHGKLQLPGPVMTELYLIDRDIWFRSGTSSWENLAGTAEGEQTANLLRNTFSLGGSASPTSTIAENAVVTNITEDPSGCKLYVLNQPSQEGGNETIALCVKNDLPNFLSAQTPDGKTVEVRYWDYNRAFNLYAPVRK